MCKLRAPSAAASSSSSRVRRAPPHVLIARAPCLRRPVACGWQICSLFMTPLTHTHDTSLSLSLYPSLPLARSLAPTDSTYLILPLGSYISPRRRGRRCVLPGQMGAGVHSTNSARALHAERTAVQGVVPEPAAHCEGGAARASRVDQRHEWSNIGLEPAEALGVVAHRPYREAAQGGRARRPRRPRVLC